jgi:hypothetical protein
MAANGTVNHLEESYKKPGLMKIDLMLGNSLEMVDSASLFVSIYLLGYTQKPEPFLYLLPAPT